MHLTAEDKARIGDGITVVKEPPGPDRPAQRDPDVSETVSAMLLDIERRGLDAVRHYAEQLDHWSGTTFEVSAAQLRGAGDGLPGELREALDAGAERTRRFAAMQRERLVDFEDEVIPGVVCGQRYVPVQSVGAYLPA